MPLVSLIIPSHNGGKTVMDCLKSLMCMDFKNFEVILVDNGSTDDSARRAREAFPTLRVLRLSKNMAFGTAVNSGIASSKSVYVGFLDNDIVVSPSWLSELTRVIDENTATGIVGGMVYVLSSDRIIYSAGGLVDMRNGHVRVLGAGTQDNGKYEAIREVDWVAGGCCLIRRELLDKVGYIDEGYGFYRDEVDLGVKARNLGYRILFVPHAIAWHKGSATMTMLGSKFYYLYRSWLRFVIIHADAKYLIEGALSVVLITLAKSFVNLFRGNRNSLQQGVAAIYWNLAKLPLTLSSRKKLARLEARA